MHNNSEVLYLKDLISNNDKLVKDTKTQLTIILKQFRFIGIDLKTGLSDDIYLGNIGIDNPELKIKYLLSKKSNIREKTVAISNIIKTDKSHNIENARIFYNYIMKNKNKLNMRKVYELIQNVTKNTHPERLNIDNDNIVLLWCPLLFAFSGYIFKKSNIISEPCHIKTKTLHKNTLIEELSNKEKIFLINKSINIDVEILEIETGIDVYKNTIDKFKYYNEYNDIAGVSGHAILHFTIGLMFDIDYKYILLAQLITMTSIHHSMMEICWAAHDIGIMKLYDNHEHMMRELKKIFRP